MEKKKRERKGKKDEKKEEKRARVQSHICFIDSYLEGLGGTELPAEGHEAGHLLLGEHDLRDRKKNNLKFKI